MAGSDKSLGGKDAEHPSLCSQRAGPPGGPLETIRWLPGLLYLGERILSYASLRWRRLCRTTRRLGRDLNEAHRSLGLHLIGSTAATSLGVRRSRSTLGRMVRLQKDRTTSIRQKLRPDGNRTAGCWRWPTSAGQSGAFSKLIRLESDRP